MAVDKKIAPVYQHLSQSLADSGFEAGPSEIHGLLTGVLVLPDAADVDWLELIMTAEAGNANVPGPELAAAMLNLYQATEQQLANQDFGYALYLPDLDQGVANRAAAVAAWCHGFLLGISATGLTADNCSDVVREILADIVELSHVETEESGVEEEKALMEIEEYLRVATQLLKEELAAISSA